MGTRANDGAISIAKHTVWHLAARAPDFIQGFGQPAPPSVCPAPLYPGNAVVSGDLVVHQGKIAEGGKGGDGRGED